MVRGKGSGLARRGGLTPSPAAGVAGGRRDARAARGRGLGRVSLALAVKGKEGGKGRLAQSGAVALAAVAGELGARETAAAEQEAEKPSGAREEQREIENGARVREERVGAGF